MSVEYWLWLSFVLGFGSDRAGLVLRNYGTAEEFYKADNDEKIKLCRLTGAHIKRLTSIKRGEIHKTINDCKKLAIDIITPDCENFPKNLLHIADPPLVLYCKGIMPDFNNKPLVTIVGPRRPTNFGEKSALALSARIAKAGGIIVSGGAVGCDTFAHQGALAVNGTTVAVLGCGIGTQYLMKNEELREKILQNGCLISEFPPYYSASKTTFPMRNRIMSALSYITIVVEGMRKSGTLITARHAVEQGKEVFVIPGNPVDPKYEGSNSLIRDGATPLFSILDVLGCIHERYPDFIRIDKTYNFDDKSELKKLLADYTRSKIGTVEPKSNISNKLNFGENQPCNCEHNNTPEENPIKSIPDGLSKNAIIVYNIILVKKYITADDAVYGSELSVSEVFASLTELEIFGVIAALPGGRYEFKK